LLNVTSGIGEKLKWLESYQQLTKEYNRVIAQLTGIKTDIDQYITLSEKMKTFKKRLKRPFSSLFIPTKKIIGTFKREMDTLHNVPHRTHSIQAVQYDALSINEQLRQQLGITWANHEAININVEALLLRSHQASLPITSEKFVSQEVNSVLNNQLTQLQNLESVTLRARFIRAKNHLFRFLNN
jgi:hypothetical protein